MQSFTSVTGRPPGEWPECLLLRETFVDRADMALFRADGSIDEKELEPAYAAVVERPSG